MCALGGDGLAVQGPINNIVPVTVGLFGRLVARRYLV
jgi:hypothetical protein